MKALKKLGIYPVVLLSLSQVTLANSKIIESIVAIVNDEIITMSDVESYKSKLKKNSLSDDLIPIDSNVLAKDPKKLIDYIINDKVIDSEIKKNNLSVTIERVEQEIRSIAAKNGMKRDQLKDVIAKEGVDFATYQDFIKRRLERQALIEREITSKLKVSDDDVTSYYLSKAGVGKNHAFSYKLSHILFLIKNSNAEEAKHKARSVLEKVRTNAKPFSYMAEHYSEDPNFAAGGEFGTFVLNELSSNIRGAIAKMHEGDVSEPLETKMGIHLFKVEKKLLIPNPEFEKQKDEIRALLFQKAFEKQFAVWLEQKRQEAFIRIN